MPRKQNKLHRSPNMHIYGDFSFIWTMNSREFINFVNVHRSSFVQLKNKYHKHIQMNGSWMHLNVLVRMHNARGIWAPISYQNHIERLTSIQWFNHFVCAIGFVLTLNCIWLYSLHWTMCRCSLCRSLNRLLFHSHRKLAHHPMILMNKFVFSFYMFIAWMMHIAHAWSKCTHGIICIALDNNNNSKPYVYSYIQRRRDQALARLGRCDTCCKRA